MQDQPVLTATVNGGVVGLVASGPWTVEHAQSLAQWVDRSAAEFPARASVTVNLAGVTRLDTYGATLLANIVRRGDDGQGQVIIEGLAPAFARLYDTVCRSVPASAVPAPHKSASERLNNAAIAGLETARRFGAETGRESLKLLSLLGAVMIALGRVVRTPKSFRLTAFVSQFDRVGWQAVPIIGMITFLIGGIIAQQGFFHFRKFGADQYVVDMVGLLVVREIGVLLVAIMVAGRSGSSYTAELGSMKMREEIDALGTMGLDPVAVLIVPRILALILALPALTLLGCIAALLGGGFVAAYYGDMSPAIYIARLQEALSTTHFKVGIIKAPFMALGIGLIACSEGLKVGGSAESLGLRTTISVVKSIFLVIVLDGLFAMYFAAIGM